MTQHHLYHFSITVRTDDLALLNCLRALSAHVQVTGNARIPWGGTKKSDWESQQHQVTFRFSSDKYRQDFINESKRLLPQSAWSIVGQSDDDPAAPQ